MHHTISVVEACLFVFGLNGLMMAYKFSFIFKLLMLQTGKDFILLHPSGQCDNTKPAGCYHAVHKSFVKCFC